MFAQSSLNASLALLGWVSVALCVLSGRAAHASPPVSVTVEVETPAPPYGPLSRQEARAHLLELLDTTWMAAGFCAAASDLDRPRPFEVAIEVQVRVDRTERERVALTWPEEVAGAECYLEVLRDQAWPVTRWGAATVTWERTVEVAGPGRSAPAR